MLNVDLEGSAAGVETLSGAAAGVFLGLEHLWAQFVASLGILSVDVIDIVSIPDVLEVLGLLFNEETLQVSQLVHGIPILGIGVVGLWGALHALLGILLRVLLVRHVSLNHLGRLILTLLGRVGSLVVIVWLSLVVRLH